MKLLFYSIVILFTLSSMQVWALTFEQAEALYQRKSFDAARQELLKYAGENAATPEGITARFHAAKCLFEKKDFSAFEKEGRDLLKQYPQGRDYDRNEMEFFLARIPLEQGNLRAAVIGLDDVATRHATSVIGSKARKLQGDTLSKLNEFDQAREVYQKLARETKKAPWAMQAKHRAARCLYNKEDFSGFAKEARELLSQNPPADDHDVQLTKFDLAHVPGKLGRSRESAEALEDFIAKNPKFTQFGLALHRCGFFYMAAADHYKQVGKDALASQCAEKGKAMLTRARIGLLSRIEQEAKVASSDNNGLSMYLETYFFEHDYHAMADEARKYLASSAMPSLRWAVVTHALGVAQANMSPPDYKSANENFDAILNAKVVDSNLGRHIPTNALFWKAAIANAQKDDLAKQAVVETARTMPEGPIKKSLLERYGKPKR